MKEVNTGLLTNWPNYYFFSLFSGHTMPDVSTWGSRYCMLEAIYFCFCFTQRCTSSMGKIFRHIDTGEAGPIKLKCKLAGASSVQMCVCMSMCKRIWMNVRENLFFRGRPLLWSVLEAALALSGSYMGTWWDPSLILVVTNVLLIVFCNS